MSTEMHRIRLLLNTSRAVDDDEVADALFEAGLGDVTFGVVAGVPFADVERSGETLEQVVLDAIRAIEGVGDLSVVRVEPDELVTATRIAARTDRTRQSVGQLISGERGPGGFPSPLAFVDARTRVWRWCEVQSWFAEHYPADVEALEAATPRQAHFLAALNGALALREHLVHYVGGGGDDGAARQVLELAGARRRGTNVDPLRGASTVFLNGCLCASAAPEADALTHLSRRVVERIRGVRTGYADVLTDTIKAYDASIILHNHGRSEAARSHDRTVIGNGLMLITGYSDPDWVSNRWSDLELPDGCCEVKHVHVGYTRPCSHQSNEWRTAVQRWVGRSPSLAMRDQWLQVVRALESASDAVEPDSIDYGLWLSSPRGERPQLRDRDSDGGRPQSHYASFALAQTLASLAHSALQPDERHLLEEISDHVNRELVE